MSASAKGGVVGVGVGLESLMGLPALQRIISMQRERRRRQTRARGKPPPPPPLSQLPRPHPRIFCTCVPSYAVPLPRRGWSYSMLLHGWQCQIPFAFGREFLLWWIARLFPRLVRMPVYFRTDKIWVLSSNKLKDITEINSIVDQN